MAKRKYLSPKERRAMLEAQNCQCTRCKNAITLRTCIAEHTVCVALGNASKPDCLLCIPCADKKTNGSPATSYGSDKHAIAKVKRLRGETKTGPKGKIPSRPMQKPPADFKYTWGAKTFTRENSNG